MERFDEDDRPYFRIEIDPEFQGLIPPLSPEELAQLEANLRADGCRDPLVVWNEEYTELWCKYCDNGSGQMVTVSPGDGIWTCDVCGYGLAPDTYLLLDGHNRYRICQALDIPYTVEVIDLPDREAAADWIDANQLGRRNLSPDQMSLLRGRRYNRAKKALGAPVGNQNAIKQSRQNDGVVSEGTTAERLAAQHGVSPRTIERDGEFARAVQQVKQVRPDIEQKILTHQAPPKSSVIEAAALLKTAPQKAAAILFGEKRLPEVKRELRREAQEERRAVLLANPPPLPTTTFGLIYADPPWRYDYSATASREIENHYPTMELEEICAMDIAAITADDCLLYLWATNPKLEEALEVIRRWGFAYRTNMVWVKEHIGMGYYARQQHELLLIAKRGNPAVPAEAYRPSSVMQAPRTGHSAKPALVYDLLNQLYPGIAKVELFSRKDVPDLLTPSWTFWGNDIPQEARHAS